MTQPDGRPARRFVPTDQRDITIALGVVAYVLALIVGMNWSDPVGMKIGLGAFAILLTGLVVGAG